MEIERDTTIFSPEEELKQTIGVRMVIVGVMVILFVLVMGAFFVVKPPADFPAEVIISVPTGTSVSTIAEKLHDEQVITSPAVFKMFIEIVGGGIKAGDYMFDQKISVVEVAHRLQSGKYGDSYLRVVIPEGSSNVQIAEIIKEKLPQFETEIFLQEARSLEGYLYPDTYFFFPSTTTENVLDVLTKAFIEQTSQLEEAFLASGKSREDIITMASILEKEATDRPGERAMVAGILWKRMEKGIPLQVDAPFLYLLGKTSSELTLDDLKINSPYNTYINKGLPPTPIGNPSIDAIKAALYPTASPYLYYLHDATGTIHYGRTHEEHVTNKRLYLN